MKRMIGLSLVLFPMLLFTLGCGGSPGAAGKWTLDTAAMKQAALEDQTAGLSEDKKKEMAENPMVKAMLDAFDKMSMEMELKADGTCSSSATLHNETYSTSGTWKMEGDILSVTMKTMKDVNPKEETLKFNIKGDTLEMVLDEDEKKAGTPVSIFIRK